MRKNVKNMFSGVYKMRNKLSIYMTSCGSKWKESMDFFIFILDYAYHIIDYDVLIWTIFK